MPKYLQEVGGSYEETPPTLIDELKRDRRWCQGNLQHLRLIFTYGFFPTHRALFLNGILSYGSALLWLIFLTASSVQALLDVLVEPVYFPQHNMLPLHIFAKEEKVTKTQTRGISLVLGSRCKHQLDHQSHSKGAGHTNDGHVRTDCLAHGTIGRTRNLIYWKTKAGDHIGWRLCA